MKKTLAALAIAFASTSSFAAGAHIPKPVEGGPCANMAKYGAIKLFKANQKDEATISYSGDVEARAFLSQKSGSTYTYSVNVDESANEGADDFTVSSVFVVTVRELDPQATKCKVVSVSEVENQ